MVKIYQMFQNVSKFKDATSQIKDPELAKRILFDKNKIDGCKRFPLYTKFYEYVNQKRFLKLI